jgi:hypothetical protein
MRYQLFGSLLVAVLLVLGTVALVTATFSVSSVCVADDGGASGHGDRSGRGD